MDRLESARAKAADTLDRLRGAVDGGFAVTLCQEEVAELLALVAVLEKTLPSTGPSSDLEVKCGACSGKGCDECEGIGTFPTEAGRRVLDLVDRHRRAE
jgi:hypothetical protein